MTNNHLLQLQLVELIGDQAYLMFKQADFRFSSADPTARVYHDSMV